MLTWPEEDEDLGAEEKGMRPNRGRPRMSNNERVARGCTFDNQAARVAFRVIF